MRRLYRALAAGVVTLTAAGSVIVGVASASYAGTTTPPPWDTFGPTDGVTYNNYSSPAGYGSEGGLLFFNSAGQQITSGSTTSAPIAAYIEGTGNTTPTGAKAQLAIALPAANDPSGWQADGVSSGFSFKATTFPITSGAPSNLEHVTTGPVYTGSASDQSLSAFFATNSDGSNPDAGYYQLRIYTGGTEFDSADIYVDTTANTWTVAYPAPTAVGTSVSLSATPSTSSVQGTPVGLSATVTDVDGSTPSGTVQFEQGGVDVGSPQPVTSGQATLSTSSLALGTGALTAVFTPATGLNYSGSTSNSVAYDVTAPIATNTTLTSNPSSPVTVGTSVTFKATVTDADSSTPTGTVTFEANGSPITGASNVAVSSSSPYVATFTENANTPSGGTPFAISAVYNPPAGYGSSTGSEQFTVNPNGDATTTALTVNPSAAPINSNVTVTAAVSDTSTPSQAPTGSVTFYDNGASTSGTVTSASVQLGSAVPLTGGIASLTTQFSSVGAHNLVAVYGGTAPSFLGSTSSDVLFTALPVAASPDPQGLEVGIPAGSLLITTPWTSTTPFNLGNAVLNPANATFTASAQFGTDSNPGAGVSITDTQAAGTGWVAFAQTTDFTNGSGGRINGQNLTLTDVNTVPIPGESLQTPDVTTNSVVDTGLGGALSYGATATGTDGLQGLSEGSTGTPTAHQFAATNSFAPGSGIGSIYVIGTLTLVAPASTPAGTYTATLTFTIS